MFNFYSKKKSALVMDGSVVDVCVSEREKAMHALLYTKIVLPLEI